jgi:type II secretory pathway pseudopilin PulG
MELLAPKLTTTADRIGPRLAGLPGVRWPGQAHRSLCPPTVPWRQWTCAAFTLLELLLATVLILFLLSAAVFNFSQLQRGTALDEGAAQFEALLRFARAQAAHTGRAVQINFEDEVVDGLALSSGGLRVMWEPEPVEQPGCWTELVEAKPWLEQLRSLVAVWTVRTAAPGGSFDSQEPGAEADEVNEADEATLWGLWPPITFYPDGSSDSAEVTLVSRDADDIRQVIVVLDGLTGRIYRTVQSASTQTEPNTVESPTPPPTTPHRKPAPQTAPGKDAGPGPGGWDAPDTPPGSVSEAVEHSGL